MGFSSAIVLKNVLINRSTLPRDLFLKLGDEGYFIEIADRLLVGMPVGEGTHVHPHFFPIERDAENTAALLAEYQKRGLVPADPLTVAAANLLFLRELLPDYPHQTFWWGGVGGRELCYMQCQYADAFDRLTVAVREDGPWSKNFRYVGLPDPNA
jgi:hypothetical protein